MKRATLIALVLLLGCKAKPTQPAPRLAATAPGVPNPVNIVDGTSAGSNILGTAANPLVTTGGGGGGSSAVTVINDAGNAVPVSAASLPLPTGAAQDSTLTSGSQLAQVTNDAGNPIPNDPVPAGLKDSIADLISAGVVLSVKNAAGTFIGLYACNEGTVNGWVMCFDMATPDAGGIGGTAPKWMGLRVPAGACQPFNEIRAFTNGLVCYSSATVSTFTSASAPNVTMTVKYR